jgi:hypothetical protein
MLILSEIEYHHEYSNYFLARHMPLHDHGHGSLTTGQFLFRSALLHSNFSSTTVRVVNIVPWIAKLRADDVGHRPLAR